MRLLQWSVAGGLVAAAVLGLAPAAQAAAPVAGNTEVYLGALSVPGRGAATSVSVGNGGSIVLTSGYGYRYWGSKPSLPHLVLQSRRSGGPWTSTKAVVSGSQASGVSVRTPALRTAARTATVQYRLLSAPYRTASGAVTNTSTSTVVRVVIENQARYSGLAATVYRTVARFCPNTAVHVNELVPGRAGQYDTGSLLIEISPSVARYPAIDQRATSLHECSHERQWLNYGGTWEGRTVMLAAARRWFSTWTKPASVSTPYRYTPPAADIAPIEHAADCGAQALNPGGYLGYGGYCTPTQLQEGRRLLLGKRY